MQRLNKKFQNNLETANWAESKGYYDVAVSRRYYAILQKMLYIIRRNGYNESFEGENSHKKIKNYFSQNIKLNKNQKWYIGHIWNIKKARNKSDYSENEITREDFEIEIKEISDKILNILEGAGV
ncbi:hypothetical protein [Sebaldella sp. S0638]|uniref:hypothetical protein n=1 Tax=Sebaldella sp. S0638 TaxID=2957809 RepID=UPI00209E7990|nr:hypothetical protein [Sebaldella sp. S0638]MCP1223884.1 hypothetical protein [Sebaldella sp. S0638]